jgi:hypothetical protein
MWRPKVTVSHFTSPSAGECALQRTACVLAILMAKLPGACACATRVQSTTMGD